MKLFLAVAKSRLLPSMGWIICSVLAIFMGGIGGIFIAYLCLTMGWKEPTDDIFSGWSFLTFPYTGGFIGLVVLHIVRIRSWAKLSRKYMVEHKGWTWKYTLGLVLFDEAVWLAAIFAILMLLAAVA